MVRAIGKFGKLNSNSDCIIRISKIAGDLDALDRLLLLIKYQRHRVIGLQIALNNQANCAPSAVRLHRDIALLIGLLECLRIRLRVLLAEGGDLLPIRLKFICFLFDNAAFDSAATGFWWRLRVQLGLLLLAIWTYSHLELLSFLDLALQTNGLLLQPCVMGERLFVCRRGLFDLCELLLQFRILSLGLRNIGQ